MDSTQVSCPNEVCLDQRKDAGCQTRDAGLIPRFHSSAAAARTNGETRGAPST
jgi:hypothetical protein